MAKIQEIRNSRWNHSNLDLARMANDLEKIMRDKDVLSFCSTFHSFWQVVQEQAVTLEAALGSDDKRPPFNPT